MSRGIKILISCFLIIVLLVVLFPYLCSTSVGKNIVSRWIAKDLTVSSLHLSWFGPQEMQGVHFQEFHADEVKTDASLWDLLFSRSIGTLLIVKPKALLHETLPAPVEAAVQKAPSAPTAQKKKKKPFTLPFVGRIIISDGEIVIQSPGMDRIQFSQVMADLTALHENYALHLTGLTTQDNVSGHFDIKGKWNTSQNEGSMTAQLEHFPMKGVDQFFSHFHPQFSGVLTETIGPSCDLNLTFNKQKEGPALSIQAHSSQLHVSIDTKPQNGNLVLKQPAQLSLFIPPAAIAHTTPFAAQQGVQLQMTIQKLVLPLDTPLNSAVEANFAIKPTTIDQRLFLDTFQGSIASKALNQSFDLSVNSAFRYETLKSQLNFTTHIENLREGSLSLKGTALPVKLLDIWLKQDNALIGLLGLSLNVDLNGKIGREESDLSFKADSPFLQLPDLQLQIVRRIIHLKSPTKFSYLPPPSFQTDTIEMLLDTLNIPIERPEDATCKLSATTPKMGFFEQVQAELSIESLKNIHVKLKEKYLQTELFGSLQKNNFTLLKPFIVQGTLTNALFSHINSSTSLQEPTPISIQIEPFTLSLQKDLFSQLKLKGKAEIDRLLFTTTSVPLNHPEFQFQIDAQKQTAWFSLSSSGIEATMSIDNLVLQKGIDTKDATFSCSLDLRQFPTAHLEAWLGHQLPLIAAIGPIIDLRCKALSSPTSQTFALNAKSQFLNADAAFTVQNGQLVLQDNRPMKFSLILTPAGYRLFSQLLSQPEPPFQLAQQSVLKGSISLFKWPVSIVSDPSSIFGRIPVFQSDFKQIQLQGSFNIDSFSLQDKEGKTAYLQSLNLSVDKKGLEQPIALHLDANLSSTAGKKEGKVAVDCQIDHLFSDRGALDHEKLVAHIKGSIQRMPTLLLDALLPEARLSKLFGSTLDATVTADIQRQDGPVAIILQSPNTRASLKGQIQRGVLYLSEPIYAQITMTPSVSAFLLREANPFSISEISAQNPLTLQINPEGFALPLFPLHLTQCTIRSARLELGQIQCKNEGNLNFTLGLLKSKQFTQDKRLNLWFAPCDFQMRQSIVSIERTEILIANTYQVAIWGTIDLERDYVDMVLGLTADCLKVAFGIKDLPKDYVLQIPMKGKSDNVQISKGTATAKIAALLAWQQKVLAGALGKSTTGALFGQLLKKVGPLPDFNTPAPPAKHPFPWEIESSETPQKRSRKTKIKPTDKPLKQLLKFLN
jgi:hypothetical protein